MSFLKIKGCDEKMKKKIIICIMLVTLLITLGLSGCTNKGGTNGVKTHPIDSNLDEGETGGAQLIMYVNDNIRITSESNQTVKYYMWFMANGELTDADRTRITLYVNKYGSMVDLPERSDADAKVHYLGKGKNSSFSWTVTETGTWTLYIINIGNGTTQVDGLITQTKASTTSTIKEYVYGESFQITESKKDNIKDILDDFFGDDFFDW